MIDAKPILDDEMDRRLEPPSTSVSKPIPPGRALSEETGTPRKWRVHLGFGRVLRLGLQGLTCTALWFSGSSALAAEPAARKITLGDAIDEALSASAGVRAADLGVSAVESRVAATRSQLFPRLRAEGNLFVWDSPFDVAFSLEPITGVFTKLVEKGVLTPEDLAGASGGGSDGIRARDQVTGSLTVSVVQPITGFFALLRLLSLENAGLDATVAERETAKLNTAQAVASAYLGYLTAKSLEDVADKSLAQIEAQLGRAKALETAGVLGRVDILRLEALREAARSGGVQARMGTEISKRGLALAMGLEKGDLVEPVDDFPDPPPEFREESLESILEERSELATARARLEQARLGADVAKAPFVPSIVALATYQHSEGMGDFQPKNTFFAGASFSWDVFEWGKTWNSVQEASARAQQAEVGLQATADALRFEAQSKALAARSAFEVLGAAGLGLQSAEEAHRIQSVRYEQGAATTTDVIDAESELARARSNHVTARYNYYLALVNVARSLGRLPRVGAKEAPR